MRRTVYAAIFLSVILSGLLSSAQVNISKATYVGSKACEKCHAKIYKTWLESKHFLGAQSLKPKYWNDKTCIKCHATGFGRPGGFVSAEKTPKMMGVQCEGCHGPGSEHLEATLPEKKKKVNRSIDCRQCHKVHSHPSYEAGSPQ